MTQPPGSHRALHGSHLLANKVPHTRSYVGIDHYPGRSEIVFCQWQCTLLQTLTMIQPPGSHRPIHGLHLTANKVPHMRSCVVIGHSQRECSPLYRGEVPTHTQCKQFLNRSIYYFSMILLLKITLFTLVDLFYYYLYFCRVFRLTTSFATTNFFLLRNEHLPCTTSGFSKIHVELTAYCVVMFRVKKNSANRLWAQ